MKRILILLTMFLGMTLVAAGASDAPYRHVVLFKFRDDAAATDVRAIEQAFLALKGKIPQIQSVEWGTNVSPEGLANGFTHCFFVTFKSKSDLEQYLPHPEHQKFVAKIKGVLDKVLVVDYVAQTR